MLKKTIIAAGFAAPTLLLWTGQAAAQQTYFSVNAGINFPPDQRLEGNFSDGVGEDVMFDREVEFSTGFFGSVALGYDFVDPRRSGFSAEIEGVYVALNPDDFSFGPGIDLDPNVNDEEEFFAGNASVFGGLVNGYYNLRPDASNFTFKIGGGVGYGRVAYDIDNAFDEGDGALIYQGVVGVGYRFTPTIEGQINGRYFGATDTEFRDDDGVFPDTSANGSIDTLVATVGLVFRL